MGFKKSVSHDFLKNNSEQNRKDLIEVAVAKAVIDKTGKENILFTDGSFWMWNSKKGIWREREDRCLKSIIQDVMLEYYSMELLTKKSIESILDILKTLTFKQNHHFDVNTDSINCINGELLFENDVWVLKPHDKLNYRTSQIPVVYDPNAEGPRFEQFLQEIFAGDADAEQKSIIICELLGYCLIPSAKFETFFILIGTGANGKSVLLNVTSNFLGLDNIAAVKPSEFNNKFQRAYLQGKLANIITEVAEGAVVADAELKAITSGEPMTAEKKFKSPFTFKPFCTCVFGTNHLPHTRDFSQALFRRAQILIFNNKFEGDNCDVDLVGKLKEELPGILNLAMEGLVGLIQRGQFTSCISSEEIKAEWRLENDQVSQFVLEQCALKPDEYIPSSKVYEAYRNWALKSGIKSIISHNLLISRLKKLEITAGHRSNSKRMLKGITLLSDI